MLVAVALMFAITRALFAIAEPEVGGFFRRMATLFRGSEFAVLMDTEENLAAAVCLGAAAAVKEELVFRFVLLAVFLHGLRRAALPRTIGRALAVLLVSLTWALPPVAYSSAASGMNAGSAGSPWVPQTMRPAMGSRPKPSAPKSASSETSRS